MRARALTGALMHKKNARMRIKKCRRRGLNPRSLSDLAISSGFLPTATCRNDVLKLEFQTIFFIII